ncbi:hypothetical protein LAZ67_9002466 [Cordylochernes scorpioides]|uniref:Uncharacterized protein n=1 Tax=Cordylochernes scorpioides TaxID=51811 RepID=A0ABY6KXJ8_9ARAC|nr:hypothetical protein LAZ67_9002466 [Cordylochernes scorpioides]
MEMKEFLLGYMVDEVDLGYNRRGLTQMIEESLGIPAPEIHSILKDHLKVSKVCCLWISYSLTDEQMTRCVSWFHEMLKKFDNESFRYVNSIITGDETWLYYLLCLLKLRTKLGYLKRGKYGIRDVPRSGRPASSVNEENIAAVKILLETDLHITYRQIEESLDIPAPAIHSKRWLKHALIRCKTRHRRESRLKSLPSRNLVQQY